MGVGELREAFNSVAGRAGLNCTLALLDYVRHNEVESQILLFRGTDASGAPFEIKSERLRSGADVNQAAKDTAQRLLDQRKPPT